MNQQNLSSFIWSVAQLHQQNGSSNGVAESGYR